MAYEQYINKRYKCKICNKKQLYPNKVWVESDRDNYIKGYKCLNCGTTNYPVREQLERMSY